jgi:tetratricopeptide (TPR) repeat protein
MTISLPEPVNETTAVQQSSSKTPSAEFTQPVEPRIHCPKCKSENYPNQVRCSFCRANLLPGESLVLRFVTFLFSLLAAGFFAWLAYQIATLPADAPQIFDDPFKPAFIAVGLFISSLWLLLRRTPGHRRYCNRADRHLELNLSQAINDYSRALEVAPKKERAEILQKRAAAYEKMGRQEEATRDRIEYIDAEGAYAVGAAVTSLFGGDRVTYQSERSKADRVQLIQSGRAIALGYCPRCDDVIPLTPELRCPDHLRTKIKESNLFVPSDMECGRLGVLAARRHRRFAWLKTLARLAILILLASIAVYFLVRSFGPGDSKSVEPSSLPAAGPSPSEEQSESTFQDGGTSFAYPSSWEIVDPSGRQQLLSATLNGLGDYEYIGGVYTGGVKTCKDCAHMVLVIVQGPGEGPMTQEQYEQIRTEAQSTMGSRLLDHRMREFGEVPAVESKYIGRSQQTQQWDILLMVPGEDRVVMFSCSAHRDEYERFEPIFIRAMETLAFAFAQSEPAAPTNDPEPAEADLAEIPVAIVNRSSSSINVRSGPGTQFSVVGGLPRNSEVEVIGRSEAGDWLKIASPSGWISVELVSLSVPVENLAIVEVEP